MRTFSLQIPLAQAMQRGQVETFLIEKQQSHSHGGLLLLAGKIQRDFANKLLSRQYNPNRERATVFSSHGSCYFLVLGYKGEDSNAKKKTSKAMQKKGYVFRFTSNTMYKHSAKTTLTTVALSLGST